MKSVLISIRPEWCDRIANGEKTIEIRKSKPKLELPFKCYIYCTKQKENIVCNGIPYYNDELYRLPNGKIKYGCSIELAGYNSGDYSNNNFLNGKVIGEFICDRIEYLDLDSAGVGFWENGEFIYLKDIGWNACLTRNEFIKYSQGKKLYGWHISELKIYDKPKKLNDFYNICYSGCDKCEFRSWDYSYAGECKEIVCTVRNKKPLARPPQSWCYVEGVNN